MRYLLRCSNCGHQHRVSAVQAGEQIRCLCSTTLEVPTLRGLRELKVVEDEAPPPPTQSWSPRRGSAFVIGLLMIIVGLIVAGIGAISRSNLIVPEPLEFDEAQADATLQPLSPSETLDLWQGVEQQGLGPYREPITMIAQNVITGLWIMIAIGAFVLVVGLGLAIGAVIAGRRDGNRAKP